jgi:hypothetical protein
MRSVEDSMLKGSLIYSVSGLAGLRDIKPPEAPKLSSACNSRVLSIPPVLLFLVHGILMHLSHGLSFRR